MTRIASKNEARSLHTMDGYSAQSLVDSWDPPGSQAPVREPRAKVPLRVLNSPPPVSPHTIRRSWITRALVRAGRRRCLSDCPNVLYALPSRRARLPRPRLSTFEMPSNMHDPISLPRLALHRKTRTGRCILWMDIRRRVWSIHWTGDRQTARRQSAGLTR